MTGEEGLRDALAGRYDIEREVGHGAMATVFLARDLRYNRNVAVKVLNSELAAALGRERFLREIEILAHLNHPHILPLLDSGDAGGFLYYVMPFVDGESLRHRLNRETQLPVDEAIAIAREVALALDYAHRQGFIHRDVKPENILMSAGYALVADFGIARAVDQASESDRLTGSGVSPGTPPYMSPEQASSTGTVDSRSDIYALGCVLYELLAGNPPFTGPTSQAVLARHLVDPVPPLRTVRRTVSLGLELAVLKALEKVPADRFATAAEFAAAIQAAPLPVAPEPPGWRRVAWSAGVAAAGLVIYLAIKGLSGGQGSGAGLDSTRYAILPFERDSGLASFNEDQSLQDAMLQWTGISVVDRPSMQEALSGHAARLTSSDAEGVARRVGAGRYVLSQVSRVGDSLRIHSAVYSASARGPPVHQSTVKIGRNPSQAGGAFTQIADRLLFGEAGPGAGLDRPTGTTSRPARQAFELGLDSVYSWNLSAADSALNAATQLDPRFAEAYLWLAQIRSWMERGRSWGTATVATWQSAAERAAAGRAALTTRDRMLSDALLALSRGEIVPACAMWSRLTTSDAYDFASWYSLANCLSRDDAVLRDPASLYGWRFRSSYHQATRAYVRALQLLPSIHRSLRSGVYESVRRVLMTSAVMRRFGHAVAPDTTTFAASPWWQGDTLAFVPNRASEVFGRPRAISPKTTLAVHQQQRLFRDIATAWVTAFPRSADALEALAISMEMLGDPAALDTIRRARMVATTPEEQLRATSAEVWMLVKFSTPSGLTNLQAAIALADSVLQRYPPGVASEPLLVASLAALTGHATLAADYSRDHRVVTEWGIPPAIAEVAFPLVVYGALGGPRDSLLAMERRFDSLSATLSSSALEDARWTWLARAATLAFPEIRLRAVTELSAQAGAADYVLSAEAAFMRGDTSKVRALFIELRSGRRFLPPAQITIDGLFPETWLLAALHDDRGAIEWLDPMLTAIAATPPQAFADPVRAGALLRAMVLRAQLAERVGDHATARRWARAVVALWSNADGFLQPLVRSMRELSG